MSLRKAILGAAMVAFAPLAVVADDLALIIGNQNYQNFNSVSNGASVVQAVRAFSDANYRIIHVADATEARMKQALQQFENNFGAAERVVVVLSGHFMHADNVTWFAPTDLRSPSLSSVGFDALPVGAVMSYLAERPGGAALFLGHHDSGPNTGAAIEKGVGRIRAPQGVTVVQGRPGDITAALRGSFLVDGNSLADAARDADGVKVSGFVSELASLRGDFGENSGAPDIVLTETLEENAYWEVVQDLGSKGALNAYLRKYPDGEYAPEAQEMIQVIDNAQPKYSPAEQAERELALSRADRRKVQEALSLLGYDPKGIDGIFGPGSRAAINRWQSQNGLEGTGFLSAGNLNRLRNQAEKEAKKLAAEARRKKQAQDAADAAFWRQTGAKGNEADLLAYLKKYPDGLYSNTAKDALERIEAQNRLNARAAETAAWDQAKSIDNERGYRDFLKAYPNGSFAKNAAARIERIQAARAGEQQNQRAKAEEEALRLSGPVRLEIERRLARLDMKPGKQDGKINKATRAAVRRYQSSRGIAVSGYLTRQTVVRLLSE